MFVEGQRVRYKTKPTKEYKSFFNSIKAGLVGEIVSVHKTGDRGLLGNYSVRFDEYRKAGISEVCNCYGVNLELIEFKYDPKQAGDTDEDI